MGLVASFLTPSLRANGSRERAPDDRLREAIQHCIIEKELDCFVACAPRNDERDELSQHKFHEIGHP
jgi:hypothetical protein